MMKPPSFPVKGVAVSDMVMEMIRYGIATTVTSFVGGKVKQTPGGTTLAAMGRSSSSGEFFTHVPLLPIIDTDDGETFYVTVTDGCVVDHVNESGSEDSLLYVDIDNILTDGVPTKFGFTSGQAIFVQVVLNADWSVESATLVVEDAGETSLNPDGETGGLLYFKLASFITGGGDPPEITYYLAGDNIHNHRPSSGLTGYITLIKGIYPSTSVAAIYLKIVNGCIAQISSGTYGDTTATGWGDNLLTISMFTSAGFSLPPTLDW